MSRFEGRRWARTPWLPCMILVGVLMLLAACGGGTGSEPPGVDGEASTGSCPVTIDVPSKSEATGHSIQISVSQSCSNWTHTMMAYIDGQRCDEAPYAFPNPGCATTNGAQDFSKSTWIEVTPGKHLLNVNNWSASGEVSVSTAIPFTYTAASTDAGADAHVDGASDSGDTLPPGTIRVTNLDQHMFKIANGAADHCTTADGHDYCAGSCNGKCAGSKSLSTYSVETGNLDPAFGSSSTRVDVSGPSSDTLEWV